MVPTSYHKAHREKTKVFRLVEREEKRSGKQMFPYEGEVGKKEHSNNQKVMGVF